MLVHLRILREDLIVHVDVCLIYSNIVVNKKDKQLRSSFYYD